MSPTRTLLARWVRPIPTPVRFSARARGDPIDIEPVIARVRCRRLIGADSDGPVQRIKQSAAV